MECTKEYAVWKSLIFNSLRLHGLYSPWYSPGQNTGVGGLSLLQGIFPTQGSNAGLPHFRQILHQLSYQGSLGTWVVFRLELSPAAWEWFSIALGSTLCAQRHQLLESSFLFHKKWLLFAAKSFSQPSFIVWRVKEQFSYQCLCTFCPNRQRNHLNIVVSSLWILLLFPAIR